MTSSKCPACGWDRALKFLSTVYRPVSVSSLPHDKDQSTNLPCHPISLHMCPICSHVFNGDFDPNVELYSEGCTMYNSGTRWSETINTIIENINKALPWHVVEIGAGDGDFLSRIKCQSRIAYEPSSDADKIEKRGGIEVRKRYFTIAEKTKFYPRTLVLMRHVLEHIQDPRAILAHLKECNASDLIIEVPCCEVALERTRLEDWTYEHVQHFTRKSLMTLVQLAGWEINECFYLYNGEVLYLSARNDRAESCRISEVMDKFSYLENVQIPEVMRDLEKLRKDGIVWWGGAGKSTMMLHQFMQQGDRVVDSDRRKVGCYVPGLPAVIEPPNIIRPNHSVIITSSWRAHDIMSEMVNLGLPNHPLKISEGVLSRV